MNLFLYVGREREQWEPGRVDGRKQSCFGSNREREADIVLCLVP